ncbi:2',5'-phosphodiesterase 12 [Anticarsia gemmatalis]|uniref:2',5'-phosphodiesterase 12 n=1 Tax=Anticarsia gemmatalis TaxID=129554 RepID=UPI003F758F38
MLFPFLRWSNRFFSTVISKSSAMNMNRCYFRYVQQEDKIDISFLLDIKGSARQFNFSRNPSESLQILLGRIKTNIQKVINKANKKKKNSENDEDIQIQFCDADNKVIDEHSTCKELFQYSGPVKLKMLNNEYEVVFNSPWVLTMNLPQSILAGFPVYPENFETQYTKFDKCLFKWYTSITTNSQGRELNDSHLKWNLTGNTYSYTPSTEDIGMKLKLECTPGNGDTIGPSVEALSKNTIQAGPGNCPFETRHLFTKQKLQNKSFRCVTYNILADLYCDSDHTRTVLYPYCPPYALHIDYRKQLIVKELLGYNSDVMCLQEVDRKIFKNCLKPILGAEGLDGAFYKKGKEVAEGLACFYRKDRFQFVGEESIVLAEAVKTKLCLKPIWDKIKDNTPLTERLLDRSTVSSATFLQSLDNPNELLLVANTHLYFHPDADHIRLIQGGIVIYWLMDLKEKMVTQFPGKRISVILCGDFNSVPSCGIYQLYTTGTSPSTLPDWKSNITEAVSGLSLEQNIALSSACGTPMYTNFTDGFADCLDYIFYEKINLDVEQVVPLPSTEELRLHTALPSVVFPSDHISLVSDLRFK